MIAYIDRLLDVWAAWAAERPGARLGFAPRSPIHKMMTTNAAVTRRYKYRRKRTLMVVGGQLVERHTEPMVASETPPSRAIRVAEHPVAEMAEAAVRQLPHRPREAVMLKYLHRVNDRTASIVLGISLATYKGIIDQAHYGLDGYLRGRYGDEKLAALKIC